MCLCASCARDKETCVYKGFFAESAACVFESSCAQCVSETFSPWPSRLGQNIQLLFGRLMFGQGVARWRSDVEIHDHEHDHLRSRGGRHERHNESGRDQHKTTRGHQIRSEMTLLYPWVQVLWTLTSTFLNTTRPKFGRPAVSRKAKCWSQVLSRERDRVRTIDCFLYVVGYTVN